MQSLYSRGTIYRSCDDNACEPAISPTIYCEDHLSSPPIPQSVTDPSSFRPKLNNFSYLALSRDRAMRFLLPFFVTLGFKFIRFDDISRFIFT